MTLTSDSARTDSLLRKTRVHFPRFDAADVRITPIEKGGSDRRFYRIRLGSEQSIILVKYNLERAENRHYVRIAEFLASHQIRAPRIYFHDAAEGLIWVEDLGEVDLWSRRNDPWPARRACYRSALEEIAKLHALPSSVTENLRHELPAEFDAALYRWEQSYFFDYCLMRHFRVSAERASALAVLPVLQEIPERLASLPRVLVHRDFQSQNIILRDGHAHLIDFQGLRPGRAEYDVASLLFDPYVALPPEERAELYEDYCALRGNERCARTVAENEILRWCAMQRLMQALGAYAYLGHVTGNAPFLAHIPAALALLREILESIDGTAPLQDAVAGLA